MKNLLMLSVLLCVITPRITNAQVINTFAGTFNGDGLGPTSVGLNASSQAIDAAGNVYITVPDRHLVMKLSASGIFSTFAGNGTYGSTGDKGQAKAAQFKNPWSVAIDKAGNVYIADNQDNRVRKVAPDGTITAFAGTSSKGFSGDGGLATAARLSNPDGLAIDAAGNVYIADYANRRIRKVSAGIITTVAGNGNAGTGGDGGLATAAQIGYITAVAISDLGEIFIGDNVYGKVRKVNTAGIISTAAGKGTSGFSGDGGPATAAQFNAINGVTVDNAGILYIADSYNNRVRKVATNGIVTTIAGTGGGGFAGDGGLATAAQLNRPVNITVDASGNLLVTAGFRVRKITTSTGIITTFAGNGTGGFGGDNGAVTKAQLYHPIALAVDNSGNTYFADRENHRVRKISASGIITTIAGTGQGGFSGDNGPATAAKLYYPLNVAVDAAGNVYIADNTNQRIRKISTTGIITTVAGVGGSGFTGDGTATAVKLYGPDGLAVDAAGSIYFADTYNNRVRKISNGVISTIAGTGTASFSGDGGAAKSATLYWPKAVAVDKAGNVYIADRRNNRIRKITASTGIITTIAGTGANAFSGDGGSALLAKFDPGYVAVDTAGNVFIADTEHDRIRIINKAGIISSYAGGGGSYGDGGAPTAAKIRTPTCVTTNTAGNVFFAEYDNHRLRKITSGNGTGTLGRSAPIVAGISSNIKFSVYPSPVISVLNIQAGAGSQLTSVEIIDVSGKIILTRKVSEFQSLISIPVQQLPRGTYFVKVTDKTNLTTMKEIIKE